MGRQRLDRQRRGIRGSAYTIVVTATMMMLILITLALSLSTVSRRLTILHRHNFGMHNLAVAGNEYVYNLLIQAMNDLWALSQPPIPEDEIPGFLEGITQRFFDALEYEGFIRSNGELTMEWALTVSFDPNDIHMTSNTTRVRASGKNGFWVYTIVERPNPNPALDPFSVIVEVPINWPESFSDYTYSLDEIMPEMIESRRITS